MRWLIHAMDRPGVVASRAGLAAAHAGYLAEQISLTVVMSGALLTSEDGPLFGVMYVVDANSRHEVDQFLAANPFRLHGIWRQVLVRPVEPDRPRKV